MSARDVVHVFDFDGVLAAPYTHPELLFPGVEKLLQKLYDTDNVVLVASFNPRAYHVMRDLYEAGVVSNIRAGSNDQQWWLQGDGVYRDKQHRQLPLSKSVMIQDMTRQLVHTQRPTFFYDDDEENIENVRDTLPHVRCHHVKDWSRGLQDDYETLFGHN